MSASKHPPQLVRSLTIVPALTVEGDTLYFSARCAASARLRAADWLRGRKRHCLVSATSRGHRV